MSTLEICQDRRQRNVLGLQRLLVGYRGDRKRNKNQVQSCEQEQHMVTFGIVGDTKNCELPMEPADAKKRQEGRHYRGRGKRKQNTAATNSTKSFGETICDRASMNSINKFPKCESKQSLVTFSEGQEEDGRQ